MIYRVWFVLLFAAVLLAGACADAPGRDTPSAANGVEVATVAATVALPVYPTLTPNHVCQGAPESRLILEERGRVRLTEDGKALNLRAGPGISQEILDQIEPLSVFLVGDEAACSDGYSWFLITYRGQAGWIAEGDSTAYYAEPHLPG